MIKINDTVIDRKHFPDGTQMLLNLPDFIKGDHAVVFTWNYENDEELVTLYFLVNYLNDKLIRNEFQFILNMPYVPNARMDRVQNRNEVFTLKYFCRLINEMRFDRVFVLDPHSAVSEALINNLCVIKPDGYIKAALRDIEGYNIDGGVRYGGTTVIYFPDAGAMKRYNKTAVIGNREVIYGAKDRNWETGAIEGIKVLNRDGEVITDPHFLDGKVVLMIDDIVSYGGTLAYSADAIKGLGASAIYAYVSHTENSVLNEERGTLLKRLNDGLVDELFTTDSIYTGTNDRITVINNFDIYEQD